MEQIRCRNLTIRYGAKVLLENLTFTVNSGDYLCIIGENGSGKTTLMKTLLGMRSPAEGSVEFAAPLKNTDVGYLPQQGDVQKDFPASVWEIVLSGCQNSRGKRPIYNRKEKRRAEENLIRLNIQDIRRRCYSELSGGQQQRVLLARALCAAQKVLLLDEPVTGLDPIASSEMYGLVKKINDDGVTIIMISHDIKVAMNYADHVLFLGDSPFFGNAEEFRERIIKTMDRRRR